jgi:hypothetical protein
MYIHKISSVNKHNNWLWLLYVLIYSIKSNYMFRPLWAIIRLYEQLLKTRHVKKGGGERALHYHIGWGTVIIVHSIRSVYMTWFTRTDWRLHESFPHKIIKWSHIIQCSISVKWHTCLHTLTGTTGERYSFETRPVHTGLQLIPQGHSTYADIIYPDRGRTPGFKTTDKAKDIYPPMERQWNTPRTQIDRRYCYHTTTLRRKSYWIQRPLNVTIYPHHIPNTQLLVVPYATQYSRDNT